MMKLKKIDGGMYCFLLTFDPATEVINIMDLQANHIGIMQPQLLDENQSRDANKEDQKPVVDTTKQKTAKTLVSKHVEHTLQNITEPEESIILTTSIKAAEQAPKQDVLPKPVREYKPHELLTRRETAAYLGVTEQTLAVWKCTGRYNIPYLKIGRLVKYRVADLDAYLDRVRHGPPEEKETQKSNASSRYRTTRKVEF